MFKLIENYLKKDSTKKIFLMLGIIFFLLSSIVIFNSRLYLYGIYKTSIIYLKSLIWV